MASQEYLEEIWSEAKKVMPGWMYATLHMAAKARAGGRAAHRAPEPTAIERLALAYISPESIADVDDKELKSIWKRLQAWHVGALRKKQSPEDVVQAAKIVCGEISKRGIKLGVSALYEDVGGIENVFYKIAFIGTCPEVSEDVRKVFIEKYLQPLKLVESEVWQFNIIPEVIGVEEIEKHLGDWEAWALDRVKARNPAIVIALGKTAKRVLGKSVDYVLPHPAAISKFHDSGEVGRKLKQIARRLQILDKDEKFRQAIKNSKLSPSSTGDHFADIEAGSEAERGSGMIANIAKADTSKHIVYGVVMDPYGETGAKPDAHNDFILPSTIEEAAHEFMRGSRTIGRQHQKETDAEVVESWVEMYPTQAEYQKAIEGKDHKVLRRKFGSDVVHSGSWILGVKLGGSDWKAYESGELNAFSPGGIGFRQPISPEEMPKVEFIDLVEKTNG